MPLVFDEDDDELNICKFSANEYLFLRCCQNGNLELMDWLLYLDTNILIDFKKYVELSFSVACEWNQVEVAKYILQKNAYCLELSETSKWRILMTCCEDGYLDILDLLISVIPNVVSSLHKNKQYELFSTACDYYNLDVARYLFWRHPSIPINSNNDEWFLRACQCNMLEMARMFVSIRPNAYYIDVDKDSDEIVHYEVLQALVIMNHEYMNPRRNTECSICYDAVANVLTSCNHVFCLKCIEKHYERNGINCPYCRKENYESDLTLLF